MDSDVTARDSVYGRTELHRASKNGETDTVKRQLEKGADVTARDDGGRTPLIWASQEGKTEVVKLLLEWCSDIDARSNYNWTALIYASYNGHTDTVRVLVEKGADLNAKNNIGQTAADRANNQEIKQILQRGKHWIWFIRIVTHIDKIICCYLQVQ